ncbi:hypothetical protein NMY22_g3352 [Coprinellus aureogranulatus]|nr:hypothetical protein NMY22_g3352 [Coprinellus aureogranulatus]
MQSSSLPANTLVPKMKKALLRARVETLLRILPTSTAPSSNVIVHENAIDFKRGMDPTLAVLVIELTELDDAAEFFGEALKSVTDEEIRAPLMEGGVGTSVLSVLLANCEGQYGSRYRDRTLLQRDVEGPSAPDLSALTLAAPVPASVTHALRGLLASIGASCLIDIRNYWSSLPPRRPREKFLILGPSPGPAPHQTLPSPLLSVPLSPLQAVAQGVSRSRSERNLDAQDSGLIYSTPPRPTNPPGALVSTSPSLALEFVQRSDVTAERGDRNLNSPYAKQLSESAHSLLDAHIASSTKDDDGASAASGAFEYQHYGATTSSTALTAPTNDFDSGSPVDSEKRRGRPHAEREGGGKVLKKAASVAGSMLRYLGTTPTSSKGRSREPSRTRSDAPTPAEAATAPPLPPLPHNASTIPAGAKPVHSPASAAGGKVGTPHITRDHQSFFFPHGTGVEDDSEKVVGLLQNLDDLTVNKIRAGEFSKNLFDHQKDCFFKVDGSAKVVIVEAPAPVPADGADQSFQKRTFPSCLVKFMFICANVKHAGKKCTLSPFPYFHLIDLNFLGYVETYSAERAQEMSTDAIRQVTDRALAARDQLAQEGAGPSGST